MTIKQYGGVFGRNPTFNDVTIEGQLTFDGDIDINSDLKVSGDIETTGNVIIATSGKGIDFSATAGTGTSELFSDYEEGVWTPTQNTFTTWDSPTFAATYTKVGRLVTLNIVQTGGVIAASSAGLYIGGSPYSAAEFSAGAVSDGNINDYGKCVMSGTTIFFSNIIPAEINLIVTITFHVA